MDPDEALETIRELIKEFNALSEDNFVDALRAADQIVENFTGLDAWITKGGFLPTDWKKD